MKDTLKLWIPNGAVLGVATLSNLEVTLKVILLLLTISYTAWNWWRKWKHDRRYRDDRGRGGTKFRFW